MRRFTAIENPRFEHFSFNMGFQALQCAIPFSPHEDQKCIRIFQAFQRKAVARFPAISNYGHELGVS